MSNLKPSDYHIGDLVEFNNPISGDRLTGKIAEMQFTDFSDGLSGWSEADIWIEIESEENPEQLGRAQSGERKHWQHFHTGLFAETDLYWFAGDREAEATPEERGCWTIRKLEVANG